MSETTNDRLVTLEACELAECDNKPLSSDYDDAEFAERAMLPWTRRYCSKEHQIVAGERAAVVKYLRDSAREHQEGWEKYDGSLMGEYHRGGMNEAGLSASAFERGEHHA